MLGRQCAHQLMYQATNSVLYDAIRKFRCLHFTLPSEMNAIDCHQGGMPLRVPPFNIQLNGRCPSAASHGETGHA